MCIVIITARSLVWLLISIVAFMFLLTGIMTPKWLTGKPIVIQDNVTSFYIPSVGIYNRCIRMANNRENCGSFAFHGLMTDSSVYPSLWKATMFFLSLSAAMQFCTVLAGVLACCVQDICQKTVISITGTLQAIVGVFGIIGLVHYPFAWGEDRVKRLCGDDSEPFLPGDCSIGWALYVTMTGVALIFVSSALSRPADLAANSDRVQFKLDEGNHLICVA